MPLFIRNGEKRKLYKDEYAKQKELAKQERRKRMLEQTKSAAKKRAHARYNVTPVERIAKRKKSMAQMYSNISKAHKKHSTTRRKATRKTAGKKRKSKQQYVIIAGKAYKKGSSGSRKRSSKRKSSPKRKTKSVWDMELSDMGRF